MFAHIVADLVLVVVVNLASAFKPSDRGWGWECFVQTVKFNVAAFFGVKVSVVVREEGRIYKKNKNNLPFAAENPNHSYIERQS